AQPAAQQEQAREELLAHGGPLGGEGVIRGRVWRRHGASSSRGGRFGIGRRFPGRLPIGRHGGQPYRMPAIRSRSSASARIWRSLRPRNSSSGSTWLTPYESGTPAISRLNELPPRNRKIQ